ncbi:MAG: hypothetical protein WCX27_00945 [Candidatus Paceibacterota bacterium]|jgi:hypothetical protein
MKNKTIILVVVIILVSIGIYLFKQKAPETIPVVTENKSEENALNNATGTPNSLEVTAVKSPEVEVKQIENKLVTDYFTIEMPTGWLKAESAAGAIAIAANPTDKTSDTAATKIGFKSYFAVTHDTLEGNTFNEYAKSIKDELKKAIPSTSISNEQSMIIDGRTAYAFEASMTQQGINFKVLMVLVRGNGEDVWAISFNTTKDNWDKYKDSFYTVANSFILKK